MNTAYNTGAIRRVCFPQNTQIEKIKKHPVRDASAGGAKKLLSLISSSFTLYMSWGSTNNADGVVERGTSNIKQFLNYQGVVIEKNGVKSVVKQPEISLFSNVFTGGLGWFAKSPLRHGFYRTPANTGVFSFICLNRSKNRSNL